MFVIWKIKRILFNSLISILLITISFVILVSQGINTVQGIIGWLLLNVAIAIISFVQNRKDKKLSNTSELLDAIKGLTNNEPLPLESYPKILDKLLVHEKTDYIKKSDYNFQLKITNAVIINYDDNIKYLTSQLQRIIDDELFFDLYAKIDKSKLPQSIRNRMLKYFKVVYGDITIKEMAQFMYILMFSLKSTTDMINSLGNMQQGILLMIPSFPDFIIVKCKQLKIRRFRDISVLGALTFCCFICIFFGLIIFILFKYLI